MFTKGRESFTHCLIRKGTDLFNNDQTGCRQHLSAHLAAHHSGEVNQAANQVWIPRYVGNRLNILFVNGGLLYHYRDTIKDYFTNVNHPSNGHQSCVALALSSPAVIIALRVLGLVGKFLAGSWQQLISDQVGILDLNDHFCHAKEKVTQWITDPLPVLDGSASAAFDVEVLKDATFESLIKQGSKLVVPGRPNLPETLSDHQTLVYQWPGGPPKKSGEGNSKLLKISTSLSGR